jgi:N-acetylneuraminate synthase/N,N'-diacetyllegionaminate synthase
MNASFEIGGRPVGGPATGRAPLFVVAEIGLNHGGDPARALALVDAAARAGVSAVKLQSLRGHRLVAPDCPAPMHVRATSLAGFFAGFELDEDAHRAVCARARAHGLAWLSTPFDEDALAMLVRLGADAIKIASGDLTHKRLVEAAAATGRPLIVSTGMATLDEVARAVGWARHAGARDLALLHCVSCYPTPAAAANIGAIRTLAEAFGVPVGLSDHGTDPLAPALAVALGATIYERHLVLDAADPAIDRAVSSTPEELADVVALGQRCRVLLGDGRKRCLPAEAGNVAASRRGVHAARDLAAGARLAPGDLVLLRPERGVGAADVDALTGRRLAHALADGDSLGPGALAPHGDPPA